MGETEREFRAIADRALAESSPKLAWLMAEFRRLREVERVAKECLYGRPDDPRMMSRYAELDALIRAGEGT
jgi:hypothetical protein